MESLLLFRRALPSPTMCRFIPALSDPHLLTPISRFRRGWPGGDAGTAWLSIFFMPDTESTLAAATITSTGRFPGSARCSASGLFPATRPGAQGVRILRKVTEERGECVRRFAHCACPPNDHFEIESDCIQPTEAKRNREICGSAAFSWKQRFHHPGG
jgi:hypothetical protein